MGQCYKMHNDIRNSTSLPTCWWKIKLPLPFVSAQHWSHWSTGRQELDCARKIHVSQMRIRRVIIFIIFWEGTISILVVEQNLITLSTVALSVQDTIFEAQLLPLFISKIFSLCMFTPLRTCCNCRTVQFCGMLFFTTLILKM